jgi:putative membrane protein insertion efficiency factor
MRVRPRRLAILLAALFLGLFAFDVTRPPERQLSGRMAVAGIHAYQQAGAPLVHRAGVRCRFEPSCSRYAEASVKRYGFVRGGWRAARRIVRCGPWTPMGTVDEP